MKTPTEQADLAQDINIVKLHLKNKLWRTTTPKELQHIKWQALISELCDLHKVDKPAFIIEPETHPHYNVLTKTIVSNKYSVITMLHELAHHIWGSSERTAQFYSETTFLTAYKPAQKKLVRDKRGFLVKKEVVPNTNTGAPATAGEGN